MSSIKTIKHGINYNPSWITWAVASGQLSDSDFFNDAFQALWNTGGTAPNVFRDDLGTISNAGLNLIRLFNWGPTRGWDSKTKVGTGHINALDRANTLNMKVIVPVSNYFLSDDQYAWNKTDPDATYSFGSAPTAIQTDLNDFISSVTVNGALHKAVHTFSVGNEIDLNTMVGQGNSGPVSPSSRVKRVIWWMVNLQAKCSGSPLFTFPISNGDQGGTLSTPPSYWFQAFINGITASTNLPQNTVGGTGTTFTSAAKGLSTVASGYVDWYYNSVNIYTTGDGLMSTIGQYDNWKAETTNTLNWPGQQFKVPLMLTEVGFNKGEGNVSTGDQETQYTTVVTDIITAIKTYLSGAPNSLLLGYCLYEFNDEITLKANWGATMIESPTEPSGEVLYQASTGDTVVSFTTFPTIDYPVNKLFPVKNTAETTLLDGIKAVITS